MQGDDFKKVSEMKPLNSQLSFATSSPAGILFRNVLALLMLMLLAESAPAQINCGAGTSSPSSNLACLVQVAQTPSGLSPASRLQRAPPGVAAPVLARLDFHSS